MCVPAVGHVLYVSDYTEEVLKSFAHTDFCQWGWQARSVVETGNPNVSRDMKPTFAL